MRPSARPSNLYHFVTRWRVEGTCGEVADVLADPLTLTAWWPSVYLGVRELEPPNAQGIGRRVRLLSRGWLPYTLRWEFEVTQSRYPHGFSIRAAGDFDGHGVWTIEQSGSWVDVTYDWRISAEKPLLRILSPLVKPVFEANHRWAMAQGETSLRLELARRRAGSDAAGRGIPPPPGPVSYAAVAFVGALSAAFAGLVYLLARVRRRRR
jgi:hypothetical protein